MAGQRDRSSGLVLGLTMAETAILIIFVLLLALTALLGREAERRRSAEDELERLEEVRLVLEESNLQPKEAVDLLRARENERQDADNWRDLVRGLAEEPPPSPTHIAKRLREARKRDIEHGTIDESLRAAGVEPTSETLRELAAIVAATHEAGVTSNEAAKVIGIYRALDNALGRLGDRMTPATRTACVRWSHASTRTRIHPGRRRPSTRPPSGVEGMNAPAERSPSPALLRRRKSEVASTLPAHAAESLNDIAAPNNSMRHPPPSPAWMRMHSP